MIGEKELARRLKACIETDLEIPSFQMGVANQVVRRIVPMILTIIKEELRTARREASPESRENR